MASIWHYQQMMKLLEIANRLGLDLVMIAADAKPPVCKIMDYGKFRYQQEKSKKKQRKNKK